MSTAKSGAASGAAPANTQLASLGRTRSALAEGLGSVGNVQSGGIPDNIPLFGGWQRVIPGPLATGTDFSTTHGLRVIPRYLLVLGLIAGSPGAARPDAFPGTAAWTQAHISFRVSASVAGGQSLVLLIF